MRNANSNSATCQFRFRDARVLDPESKRSGIDRQWGLEHCTWLAAGRGMDAAAGRVVMDAAQDGGTMMDAARAGNDGGDDV